MKRMLSIIALISISMILYSCGDDKTVDPGNGGDTPSQIYYNAYGGDGDDWGRSIKISQDHTYVIAGSTDSFGQGKNMLYLLKVDTTGAIIWGNLFGGAGDDNGEDIVMLPTGEIMVVGSSSSSSSSHDFYLIKTDANGNEIWQKTFGDGNRYEWATSLRKVSDGFVMGGYTSGEPSSDQFYLVKTDLNGNLMWDSTYGTADVDWCMDMDVTQDGGFIMAGYTRIYGSSVPLPYFVKTDSEGKMVWDKKINQSGLTYIHSVITTSDGGYVAGGDNLAFSGNNPETYVVKLNSDSTIAWQYIYNTVRPSVSVEDIVECPDGSLLLTGSPINLVTSTGNLVLMKIAADGTFMWSKLYNPKGNAMALDLDIDGNVAITGFDYTDNALTAPNVLYLRIPADSL